MNAERHQRIMSILADAIECDTDEHHLVVTQACADDDSLREEVERLLEHRKPAVEFMEEPLLEAAARWQSEQEESLIGKHVGPYRLTEEIGRGGMGSVYRAVRSDDEYQRQVAIKLINPGMDTDLVLRRFRNERQILANLNHQNIARLFDGGTTGDGLSYLVMEYVEGLPIHAYADDYKLSTTERLRLFISVCEAVAYAHRSQVIHRDLKPGNILVTKDGLPKLLDFGIARALYSNTSTARTETTLTACRSMTPEYASPEQLRGDKVTAASDIYSLGVLLYELLTGHRPYNLRRSSPYEIAHVVCEVEPEKPSIVINRIEDVITKDGEKTRTVSPEAVSRSRESTPAQLRRRLAGDLDTIVLMALRKEPDRRYDSVEQFAEDIRHHLKGLPILARKDALAYRTAKFFRRNRTFAMATVVVAVLCLLIGVSLTLVTTRIPKTKSIGVMPFVNVSQDQSTEYLSDGLTDSLIDRLSHFSNLAVPAHGSVFRYKGQTSNAQAIGRELGVETVLTGRVTPDGDQLVVNVELRDSQSNQVLWSRQYRRTSSEFMSLQSEIAQEVVLNLGLPSAVDAQTRNRHTKNDEAYRLYLRGNYFWNKRTIEGFTKAIDYYEQAIERDPQYAFAYDGLAKSHGLLGAYLFEGATEPFPRAKAAALKALGLNPNLVEAHTSLALILWLHDWDWAAADREFKQAILLDPQYVTAHHWYGLYLAEMGRADEAIAEEKRALELDPVSVPVLADLGRVYFFARRYDESLEQYQKAAEMEPGFGAFYNELGYVYEQKGMTDEWFWAMGNCGAVSDVNRKAYASRNRLEFLRASANYGASHDRAQFYARLSMKDEAFEQLENTLQARDHRMSQLKVNPLWDPLRSDPRFQELVNRMKL